MYLYSDNPYSSQSATTNARSNLFNEEPVEIAQSNDDAYTPQTYESYE
jgi:hypothetical protein